MFSMLKPTLGFDTSVFNRLADAPDKDALVAAVVTRYRVCIAGLNVEEFAATLDGARRNQVFSICARLLSSGFCLKPVPVILTLMARSFDSRRDFDWRRVNVQSPEYAREVALRKISNDEMAGKQKEHARATQREFAAVFNDARPVFERLFLSGTTNRPADFAELVRRLRVEGGAFWNLAVGLYARAIGNTPDEKTVRQFVTACPPFNALVLAFLLAEYERCIRDPGGGPSLRAGRADLFMSVYLPYCDYFVTADERQFRCLNEITAIMGLGTVALGFDGFVDGLTGPHWDKPA